MKTHDVATATFYKDRRVATDYERIRYGSNAGKFADQLQKETILRALADWNFVGKHVLDVGCGTGRLTRWIASLGAEVIGVDLSRSMLAAAQSNDSQSSFIEANALQLPFRNEAFDLALSVWVYNHMASYRESIAELCRVTRRIVLALPNEQSLLGLTYPWRYVRGYNREYSGFTIRKYEGAPIPYSIYFRVQELIKILAGSNFRLQRIESCLFTFMLPPYGASWSAKADRWLSRRFPKRGTFLVIVGDRE